MPSDGDRVITMSSGEVESLRREVTALSERMQGLDGKLDLIHTAVLNLAQRTYIPGPSIWKRIGCFLGLIRL
jgi:hypothetical protein